MWVQIKKIFFFIFFLSLFLSVDAFVAGGVEDIDKKAREKRFGLEDKARDTKTVRRQKFLTDIELGNIEDVKIFLKRHDNYIDFVTPKGLHPLTHAVINGNIEIVDLFLTKTKVNINSEDMFGDTPLIKAAQIGHGEIVEYLINKGADINHQNEEGKTAAMKAVEGNHYYVVKIFINKNIDLNKSDYSGRTIKDIARNSRDKRILNLLN